MEEKRPTLIVADSHLARDAGDERQMIDFLDRIGPDEVSGVYLLGDVFHYLIGDRKFLTPAIGRTIEAVGRLRERGVPVRYVEGNRDFYLRGSFLEPLFTAVDLSFSFETGSGRCFLTHGDRINDRDYPYRFWRVASKNPVARVAMRAIPGGVARRIVSGVESGLHRSNFKHKYRLPEERIVAFARKRWAAGDRTVLLGHFHREWTQVDEEGRRIAVVPAWCETGKVALVGSDGTYRTLLPEETGW
jgi:UDP-2,3-diacylglucosamine hydrolase